MFSLNIVKKTFWFAVNVCVILMVIACVFGSGKEENRRKLGLIGHNALALVVNGGIEVLSIFKYLGLEDIVRADHVDVPTVVSNLQYHENDASVVDAGENFTPSRYY